MLHLRGEARKGTNFVSFPYKMPDITAAAGRVRILDFSASLARDGFKMSMTTWPTQTVEVFVVDNAAIDRMTPKTLAEALSASFASKLGREFSAIPSLQTFADTSAAAGENRYYLELTLPPALTLATDENGWKALGISPSGNLKAKEDIGGRLTVSAIGGEGFTKSAVANTEDGEIKLRSEGSFAPSDTLKAKLGTPAAGLRYLVARLELKHHRAFSLNPNNLETRGATAKAVQECMDAFKKSGSLYGDLKASVKERKLSLTSDFDVDFSLNNGASGILRMSEDDFTVGPGKDRTGSKWEKDSEPPAILTFSRGHHPPVLITSATHTPYMMSYVDGKGAVKVMGKLDTGDKDKLSECQYFNIDGSVELIQLGFVDSYMEPVTFGEDFIANLMCSFTPLR